MTGLRIRAWLCAASAVALGVIYMFAAGAPRTYLFVNAAALVCGVALSAATTRMPWRSHGIAGTVTVAIGVAMVVTAMFGVHLDGASRWIRIAGLSLQPSLILLPPAIVLFTRNRGWASSAGLVIAAVGLALQPDRAMAGTLAAGLFTLWLHRRELSVSLALAAAVGAFVVTMMFSDAVPPVLFVEQVVQSAFAFNVLAGIAVVAGLLVLLGPAAGVACRAVDREVVAVFGVTWLAMIVFAIIGNYPTPLVGYGSSTILGYCLSAAALDRQRTSTAA